MLLFFRENFIQIVSGAFLIAAVCLCFERTVRDLRKWVEWALVPEHRKLAYRYFSIVYKIAQFISVITPTQVDDAVMVWTAKKFHHLTKGLSNEDRKLIAREVSRATTKNLNPLKISFDPKNGVSASYHNAGATWNHNNGDIKIGWRGDF